MLRRVLVETDVILDLVLGRDPLEKYVSSLAFSNLFYLLRKGKGGGAETVSLLRKLRLVTRVLTVDEKIIDLALASTFVDFEDAIQYFAAVESALEAIVTRNRRDYKASKIAIVSAEECLELAGL